MGHWRRCHFDGPCFSKPFSRQPNLHCLLLFSLKHHEPKTHPNNNQPQCLPSVSPSSKVVHTARRPPRVSSSRPTPPSHLPRTPPWFAALLCLPYVVPFSDRPPHQPLTDIPPLGRRCVDLQLVRRFSYWVSPIGTIKALFRMQPPTPSSQALNHSSTINQREPSPPSDSPHSHCWRQWIHLYNLCEIPICMIRA